MPPSPPATTASMITVPSQIQNEEKMNLSTSSIRGEISPRPHSRRPAAASPISPRGPAHGRPRKYFTKSLNTPSAIIACTFARPAPGHVIKSVCTTLTDLGPRAAIAQ